MRMSLVGMMLLGILARPLGAGEARRPLVLPAFEIGEARSLPWGQPSAWDAALPGYDVERLAADALACLTAEAPVIVRMETLRRAVVYSRKAPRAARQLQAGLLDRVRVAEETGKADALAWFDLGYLLEIGKQAPWLDWDPFEEANGYALVRRALRIAGPNPEIEFAAALILKEPDGQIFFTRHLKFAIAEAQEGSLLARNLVIHFGDRGKTLAELKAAKVPR